MATDNDPNSMNGVSGHFKQALIQQMVEALEDQAAALYRRVAAFEEEDFLISREVEEHQTEINRLHLKLEAVRSERDRMLEKVEGLRAEASTMREALLRGEDYIAGTDLLDVELMVPDSTIEPERRPIFFHRVTLP